jgi:sugar phosphate isomerase/epimerase
MRRTPHPARPAFGVAQVAPSERRGAHPALSRREFATIVVAGIPVVAGLRAFAAGPVTLGVSTTSFNQLPRVEGTDNVDEIVRALKAVQAKHIELAFANVEPAPPNVEPFIGGTAAYPRRIVPSPQEVAATNKFYRTGIRQWRGEVDLGYFEKAGAKIAAAGMTVHACSIAYDESFTDAEIDATLKQVTALGANTVSSPMTMATAARLAPFAERHRITVAIHNDVDGNAAGAIATSQLKDALAISQRFQLKLDVGNLTASNQDAVATLREHQARVSHVLVRDRLRNGGVSQHYGEGDTPIAGVLNVLRNAPASIPAIVEYDYAGLRPSVEEVTALLAYLARTAK